MSKPTADDVGRLIDGELSDLSRLSDILRVFCSDRVQEGSCNVCGTRRDPDVIVVELRSLTFRACPTCASIMADFVKGAARSKKRGRVFRVRGVAR